MLVMYPRATTHNQTMDNCITPTPGATSQPPPAPPAQQPQRFPPTFRSGLWNLKVGAWKNLSVLRSFPRKPERTRATVSFVRISRLWRTGDEENCGGSGGGGKRWRGNNGAIAMCHFVSHRWQGVCSYVASSLVGKCYGLWL